MMPVTKLKSLDEAAESLWRRSDDPLLWRQIDSLWRMSARVTHAVFPPGVHKHRTIDAANQLVEGWDQTRLASLRNNRGLK
jgi:hypothetical protein